jgi:hypothetical protein
MNNRQQEILVNPVNIAPAGSNRSGYRGDEAAEISGVEGHLAGRFERELTLVLILSSTVRQVFRDMEPELAVGLVAVFLGILRI